MSNFVCFEKDEKESRMYIILHEKVFMLSNLHSISYLQSQNQVSDKKTFLFSFSYFQLHAKAKT